jgi:chromosome segregation ATPase
MCRWIPSAVRQAFQPDTEVSLDMETSPLSSPGTEAWAERFAATLHAERDRAREFLNAQLTRLERAESLVEQQIERLEQELQGHCDEVGRLRNERDALAARLADAEGLLQAAEERGLEQPADGEHHGVDEDGQRRYEMALDDIRQLRNRNNELQQQLAKARSTAASLSRQSRLPGSLDWEAEKQNILAALEASGDDDGGDEAEQDDHRKVAEMVQTTTAVIAEKDREIGELKQRLEELEGKAATTPNVADLDRVLGADGMIQEERERLRRLQDEWRDKLRQAEVEIALERAKIARQRAEMESQHQGSGSGEPGTTDSHDQTERSSMHGRWLARLGLTDADLVPGRHL